jgi:hypothetical protein
MVTRRRAVAKVHVLPPDVVPMTKQDKQPSGPTIAAMIAAWGREHGSMTRPDEAGTPLRIMTESGGGPP